MDPAAFPNYNGSRLLRSVRADLRKVQLQFSSIQGNYLAVAHTPAAEESIISFIAMITPE